MQDRRPFKQSQKHIAFDKDRHRETLFIRLTDPLGGSLLRGQRCYFGYTSRRYRRISGIMLSTRVENTSWNWSGGGLIPTAGLLRSVTLNIIAKSGKTFLLENFPLARLTPLNSPANYNYGGLIVRFDLDADMHASYLQYSGPAIGGGYTVPLTFSFWED